MNSLPSLRAGLLRHPLLDEVLVYDTSNDKLHLLDATTATVVELLDNGDTADAIVAKLEQQQGTDGGSQLLTLALDELAKAELTENGPNTATRIPEVTRRQMLQTFAGIGAAVLIPAVVSLTPSRAYAATAGQCDVGCSHSTDCNGVGTVCTCCLSKGGDPKDKFCVTQAYKTSVGGGCR